MQSILLAAGLLLATVAAQAQEVYRVSTRMVPKAVCMKALVATSEGLEIRMLKTVVYVPVTVAQRVYPRRQAHPPREAEPRYRNRTAPQPQTVRLPEKTVAVNQPEERPSPIGVDMNGNPTPGRW